MVRSYGAAPAVASCAFAKGERAGGSAGCTSRKGPCKACEAVEKGLGCSFSCKGGSACEGGFVRVRLSASPSDSMTDVAPLPGSIQLSLSPLVRSETAANVSVVTSG